MSTHKQALTRLKRMGRSSVNASFDALEPTRSGSGSDFDLDDFVAQSDQQYPQDVLQVLTLFDGVSSLDYYDVQELAGRLYILHALKALTTAQELCQRWLEKRSKARGLANLLYKQGTPQDTLRCLRSSTHQVIRELDDLVYKSL